MEEAKKLRGHKKIPFTRELNKLECYLSECDVIAVESSLSKLKPLFWDLMASCEAYQDILLASEGNTDLFDASDVYNVDIKTSYCTLVKQANIWLLSIANSSKIENRSISSDGVEKHEHDFKEHTMQNTEHIDLNTEAEGPVEFKSCDKLTELIKLMQLPKIELQIYDGSPLNYNRFINQFKLSVEAHTQDPLTRLNLLQQYCTGYASKLISGCSKSVASEGYRDAIDILASRCGNPHVVCEKVIHSLRFHSPVKSVTDLVSLADELQDSYTTLYELGKLHEVDSQAFFKEVLDKISIESVKGSWRSLAVDTLNNRNRYPNFHDFVEFIRRQSSNYADPVYGLEVFNVYSKPKPPVKSTSFNTTASHVQTCIACRGDHRLLKCDYFKDLSISDRHDFVNKNNLCTVCLGNHGDVCKSKYVCSVCGNRHSYLLHVEESSGLHVEESSGLICSSNVLHHKSSILPLVLVIINGTFCTYALLDTGSTGSFCTSRVLKFFQGKLDISSTSYSLETVNGTCETDRQVVKQLSIKSCQNFESLSMQNVRVVDHIPVTNNSIEISNYPHLSSLDIPVPSLQTGGEFHVDLLIGQDHSEALIPLDVKVGKPQEPFACRYLLGWTVNGAIHEPHISSSSVTSNLISANIHVQLFEKGYAERGSVVSQYPKKCLPQRANKVIAANDGVAVCQGQSLYDKCFQGTNLVNKLLYILMVCLFISMFTRVHIKFFDSIDTNSFNSYIRFRSRQGSPAKILSDNGSNLVAASSELLSLMDNGNNDWNSSSFLFLENVEWVFNPPKASNFGVAWKSLIGVFRRVINAVMPSTSISHDSLVTLFTEVEGILNSRPITKVSDDVNDASALTPNHLLLFKNNNSFPLVYATKHDYYTKRWRYIQHLVDCFWKKWLKLYLPSLQLRHKWHQTCRDFKVGDLVLILDENLPRSLWPLALVTEVRVSRDGHIRSVRVKTRATTLVRPVNKLVLLEGVC